MKRSSFRSQHCLPPHSRPRDPRAEEYDPGASDAEIRIGNTNPYSARPSYGTIGKTITAYFKMIDDQGASTAADQLHFVRRNSRETGTW